MQQDHSVLVIAQRWTDGIRGGEQFGRLVVEALVVRVEETAGHLYSAFYDPDQGQDITTAFKWWHRGAQGLVPWLPVHALNILSLWALPKEQVTSIEAWITNLEQLLKQAQTQLPTQQ